MKALFEEIDLNGLTIVLEGPDNVGKTTLQQALKEEFIYYGFDVKVCRNPDNPDLYKEIHDGKYSEASIAVLTLIDAMRVRAMHPDEPGQVIIQDRLAIVSSAIYNLPKIKQMESLISVMNGMKYVEKFFDGSILVVLNNQPYLKDTEVYADRQEEIQQLYRELEFESANNYIDFRESTSPKENAKKIIQIINERLSNKPV